MLISVVTPQKVRYIFDPADIAWIQENQNNKNMFVYLKPNNNYITILPNSSITIHGEDVSPESATLERIIDMFLTSKLGLLRRKL